MSKEHPDRRRLFLIALGACSLGIPLGGSSALGAEGGRPPLPQVTPVTAFRVSATALRTRTIADVDVLADGRIAVLDFDIRRVGVFSAEGSFERLLPLPPDVSFENALPTRIVALPDGGVVVADDIGRRFLFYDAALGRASVVPFGIETVSLNGSARHPSGDLYIVAFCAANDRILHRFDGRGQYLDSYVNPLDGSLHEKSYSEWGSSRSIPRTGHCGSRAWCPTRSCTSRATAPCSDGSLGTCRASPFRERNGSPAA